MPTFTYENDGTYVRTGECCQCGECCKTGDPFKGAKGKSAIAGACALLALLGDKHICTDRQDSYYLSGCNVWPTHPGHIVDKPSCTYKFEKVA